MKTALAMASISALLMVTAAFIDGGSTTLTWSVATLVYGAHWGWVLKEAV